MSSMAGSRSNAVRDNGVVNPLSSKRRKVAPVPAPTSRRPAHVQGQALVAPVWRQHVDVIDAEIVSEERFLA